MKPMNLKCTAAILAFTMLSSPFAFAANPIRYSQLTAPIALREKLEELAAKKIANYSLKKKEKLIAKIEKLYALYGERYAGLSEEQKQKRAKELQALSDKQNQTQDFVEITQLDQNNSTSPLSAEQHEKVQTLLQQNQANETEAIQDQDLSQESSREPASQNSHFHLRADDDMGIGSALITVCYIILGCIVLGALLWYFSFVIGLILVLLGAGLLVAGIWFICEIASGWSHS